MLDPSYWKTFKCVWNDLHAQIYLFNNEFYEF